MRAGISSEKSSSRRSGIRGAALSSPLFLVGGALQGRVKTHTVNALWAPLHSGRVAVCLQAQNHTSLLSGAVHCTGENDEPLCEPSQNGWFFDFPHAHHQ